MSDVSTLTRTVYWSPSGELAAALHQTTYLWLVVALGVMGWGIWRRIKIWKMGKI